MKYVLDLSISICNLNELEKYNYHIGHNFIPLIVYTSEFWSMLNFFTFGKENEKRAIIISG